VGVGCRRKKQRRRFPFLKIGGSFFFHIILDRGYPLPRYLIPIKMRRRSAGEMARSTSRPFPIGISFIFAMGLPRGKGLSLWIHLARVFRWARMRLTVRSLYPPLPFCRILLWLIYFHRPLRSRRQGRRVVFPFHFLLSPAKKQRDVSKARK
jgi:hypothetical protein